MAQICFSKPASFSQSEPQTFHQVSGIDAWACSADCWRWALKVLPSFGFLLRVFEPAALTGPQYKKNLGSKKYKVFDTWDCSVKASIMRRLAQKRCHLDHSKIQFFPALHALRWIVQSWLLRLKVVPSFAAEGEPCRCYLLYPSFSLFPCVFERAALTAWRWYLIWQLLCIFERAALAAEGGSFNRFNFLGQAISRGKFVIYSAGTILCLRSSIAEVPDQSLCNIKCLTECLYTTTPKCWTIPLPIAQVSQVYTCKW